jgi:hypothetical protein
MLPKFLYTGPSWAKNSYPIDKTTTNLVQQWGFDHDDFTAQAYGNSECYKKVTHFSKDMPVVWLYCEPLINLTEATGMSMHDFVVSDNWRSIRETCNQYCLNLINSLPNPVFLIGAHSDIVNLTDTKSSLVVGHPSWQKWTADKTGLTVTESIHVTPQDGGNYNLDLCWGAEIVHRFLHFNPDIQPAPSLLDAIWDVYYFWQHIERQGWFFEVHPNRHNNIEFSQFLKPRLEQFLTTFA